MSFNYLGNPNLLKTKVFVLEDGMDNDLKKFMLYLLELGLFHSYIYFDIPRNDDYFNYCSSYRRSKKLSDLINKIGKDAFHIYNRFVYRFGTKINVNGRDINLYFDINVIITFNERFDNKFDRFSAPFSFNSTFSLLGCFSGNNPVDLRRLTLGYSDIDRDNRDGDYKNFVSLVDLKEREKLKELKKNVDNVLITTEDTFGLLFKATGLDRVLDEIAKNDNNSLLFHAILSARNLYHNVSDMACIDSFIRLYNFGNVDVALFVFFMLHASLYLGLSKVIIDSYSYALVHLLSFMVEFYKLKKIAELDNIYLDPNSLLVIQTDDEDKKKDKIKIKTILY